MSVVPHSVRAGDDAGESLIEVLIAIMIMGLAFTAALGGMRLGLMGSDVHRSQATAETVLLSAVEKVKAQSGYQLCALPTNATYVGDARSAASAAGWSPSTVTITSVQYWNGTAFQGICSETASGPASFLRIQLVTMQVTSPAADATETMTFIKRAA